MIHVGGDMLNYNYQYHIIEEDEGEYVPKLSFPTLDEALEFLKFASGKNLMIVPTEELDDFIDDY
jgi:hypothetical protein